MLTLPPFHHDQDNSGVPCAMVFNANDPSGAAGMSADLAAITSIGIHTLPIVTGNYLRNTTRIADHVALDSQIVSAQARIVLEDIAVRIFKIGFVGSVENLHAVAAIVSDYDQIPVVAYMPDLSWWPDEKRHLYLDAYARLLLPQTTLLIGNHSTLAHWLLPRWEAKQTPGARDIAAVALTTGVAHTLVTGIAAQHHSIENVLYTAKSVLCNQTYERFEATFVGAGDTLSAAIVALLAAESELPQAVREALDYLDGCLENGFRPGMGYVVPERLFWTLDEDDEADESNLEVSPYATRH